MHRFARFASAMLFAMLFAMTTAPALAQTQDASFTYQGRLTSGGVPIDGSIDLAFRLHGAAEGGPPIGPLIESSAHPVTSGLFTVALDFGPASFDGSARWIEISIDGAPLAPRQRVNAYAVHTRGLDVDADGTLNIDGTVTANGVTFESDLDGIRFPNAVGETAPMITMFEDGATNFDRMVCALSPCHPAWGLAVSDIDDELRFRNAGYSRVAIDIGVTALAPALRVTNRQILHPWGIVVENPSQPTLVTGMRVSDDGFFEVTSSIDGFSALARLNSAGSWTVASDRRLKKDVAPLGPIIDDVRTLRPVSYRYRSHGEGLHIGFLAQDVRAVYPSFVVEAETLTLDYAGMSTIAVAALRDLVAETDAEVDALHGRFDRLERMLRELASERR